MKINFLKSQSEIFRNLRSSLKGVKGLFYSHLQSSVSVLSFGPVMIFYAFSISSMGAMALTPSPSTQQNLSKQTKTTQNLEGLSLTDNQDKIQSPLHLNFVSRIIYLNSQDEFNQRSISKINLGINLQYQLIQQADLRFQPRFKAKAGHEQTLNSTSQSSSEFTIKEGTFNLKNSDKSQFFLSSWGILDLSKESYSLILEDQSFMGTQLTYLTKQSGLEFGASSSLSVPNNTSSSTQTSEMEKTPTLWQGKLSLSLENSFLNFETLGGYFQYQNPTQTMATQSLGKGNNLNSVVDGTYKFQNSFEGPWAQVKINFNTFKNQSLSLAFSGVKNSVSPETQNKAWLFQTSYLLKATSRLSISPFYDQFYIEPDAVIALYSDEVYGGSNRNGFISGIKFDYAKNFIVKIMGGVRDAINENPYIQRETFYRLSLETLHAEF